MFTHYINTQRDVMSGEQPPSQTLEIEVIEWNAESFTIEGWNPQLEEQLRQRIIPRIILRTNNGWQLLENVRITNIRSFMQRAGVEHAHGPFTRQQTVF